MLHYIEWESLACGEVISECGPSKGDGFPGLSVAMARGQVEIPNIIKAVLTPLIHVFMKQDKHVRLEQVLREYGG